MALTVPGRQTVTVLRRVRQRDVGDPTKWARDERGNAVYVTESIDVPNCSVQPTGSDEDTNDGRNQVSNTLTLYAPPAFPVTAIDAVIVGGVTYEVVGEPLRWQHPRLGHVVAQLREVRG